MELCVPFFISNHANAFKVDAEIKFKKIYTKNGGKWRFSMNKNRIYRPKISDFRQFSDRNSLYYGIFSIYYFLHVSKVTRTCFK